MNLRLITLSAIVFLSVKLFGANISVENITMSPGDEKQVAIKLANTDIGCVAFQFDLVLPEGFTLAKDGNGRFAANLDPSRKSDHVLIVSEVKARTYRFVAYSPTKASISQGSGAIVSVALKCASDVDGSVFAGSISNIILSDTNARNYTLDNAGFDIAVLHEYCVVSAKNYTREYGAANPAFEYEVLGGSITGTPTVECAATATSSVGTYDIVIKQGSVTSKNVTYVNGTLTITQAPLTITANSYTRNQGEENPKFEATYSGFKNGETASVLLESPKFKCSATPDSEAGKYDIEVFGAEAQNYRISYVNGVLTVLFVEHVYKLTYLVDGEVYKSYDIKEGAEVNSEPAPVKEGYTFSGWSEVPTTMPDHDVTVTGSFTVNKYKLTYVLDGEVYKTVEVDYGTTITPETVSDKTGYTFSGWDGLPDTMPAKDVTVTGAYTINVYSLIYLVDGEEYKSYEIAYGTTITAEPTPDKEDYTFSGWSEIPETMPDHDVTVTGTFEFTPYDVEVGGIFYRLNKQAMTAGVSCRDEEKASYTGSVDIPQEIEVEGVSYRVTAIRSSAFEGCTGLVELTLPGSITSIGSLAFKGCTGLKDIFCYADDVPKADQTAFEGANIRSVTLHIPYESLPDYSYISPWNNFGDFVHLPVILYMVDWEIYKYVTVKVGDPIIPEEEPVKEGYTFSGWQGLYDIMPNKDVLITGTFTATGISRVAADDSDAKVYDLNGNGIDKPRRGVNIIREKDGKTKKLFVK